MKPHSAIAHKDIKDLKRITVGISDLKISKDPDSFLITHSLGPCIGLLLYDAKTQVGGMLHFQLPSSKGHENRAKENPYMFADTGIPLLLRKMVAFGASKDGFKVGIFGGATMMQDDSAFKIGIQNARTVKKILWQQCMKISAESVGGKLSRTVSMEIFSGHIRVLSDGQVVEY